MRDRFNERRYNRYRRNGKDCYAQFTLELYGETIFQSAEHKISLNLYRVYAARCALRNNGIYIL